jgi:hypothetical protein
MKYIITEDQYDRIVQSPNRLWILRRYNLIMIAFLVTKNEVNPCRFTNFQKYDTYFYNVLMDGLHQEYYLIDDFDYAGVVKELEELFYDELIDEYRNKIRNC